MGVGVPADRAPLADQLNNPTHPTHPPTNQPRASPCLLLLLVLCAPRRRRRRPAPPPPRPPPPDFQFLHSIHPPINRPPTCFVASCSSLVVVQPPNFQFHDPQGPIYTSPRFLPPAKVRRQSVPGGWVGGMEGQPRARGCVQCAAQRAGCAARWVEPGLVAASLVCDAHRPLLPLGLWGTSQVSDAMAPTLLPLPLMPRSSPRLAPP